MRNAREGTVFRAERETGWMNCHSGSVKWPAERAWRATSGLVDICEYCDIEYLKNRDDKKENEGERGIILGGFALFLLE
jgi:hypothetical protein